LPACRSTEQQQSSISGRGIADCGKDWIIRQLMAMALC
jgi:hypothetical protein